MYEDLIKELREYSSARKGEIADITSKAADAIEELTNNSEKVAIEYCKKRNLVMITHESFEILKSYYNRGMMPLP